MGTLDAMVIYEIFPRNHTPEGTLQAIIPDLPRIAQLGVDYIWLMPIHPIGEEGRKGSEGSPYAIQDYRTIHPDLGTMEDFIALVEAAHSHNLKVMMDIVFHHTARDARLLHEHPSWYLQKEGRPTRKVAEWSDVYDLDYHHHRRLWQEQIETLCFWATYVDGFRCDVAPLVPLTFWLEAREAVHRVHPNLLWLAETVHPRFLQEMRARGFPMHADPEMHEAFDLTYDYDGFERLEDFLAGVRELRTYVDYFYVQETLYPVEGRKLRFLENHDLPRAATLFPDKHRLRNWTAFLFLMKGATLLYAGQEYALAHRPDLFEKDPIQWEKGDPSFSDWISQLIQIKKTLTWEGFHVTLLREGIVEVSTETVHAFFNLEGKFGSFELEKGGVDLLYGGQRAPGTHRLENLPYILKRGT